MLDRTDRHCRFLLRLLSPRTLLYTEMITAAAILRGDRHRLLGFDPSEHPVALQLGGADAREMAEAAAFGAAEGYDEINLNIGCPSDRVQSGAFGACLMREPQRVADCVAAIRERVSVPVTVKTRIGIEGGEAHDTGAAARALEYSESDYERLHDFVTKVAAVGCDTFIIHARKAVLTGFSPKDNREIPPLRYDIVRRLKKDFPALTVVANGGIREASQVRQLIEDVDGVMIGREAYSNPYVLSEFDALLFPESGWQPPDRAELIERMAGYAAGQLQEGHRLHSITRHLYGLFAGQPGARQWRRMFSEHTANGGGGIEIFARAGELLRRQQAA